MASVKIGFATSITFDTVGTPPLEYKLGRSFIAKACSNEAEQGGLPAVSKVCQN